MATLEELNDALNNIDKALSSGQLSGKDKEEAENDARALADEIVKLSSAPSGTVSSAIDQPDPYRINLLNPAAAGAIGATVSMIPGVRQGSMAMKAIKGLAEGAGASLTGEVVREATNNSNVGQLVALGAEFAAGATPSLFGDFLSRVGAPGLAATFGYNRGKALQQIKGFDSESMLAAKDKIFGTRKMEPGVVMDRFTKQEDDVMATYLLNNHGIRVAEGQRPADALRTKITDTIALESAAGRGFNSFPELQESLQMIKAGINDKIVSKEEYNAILGLLNREKSKDVELKVRFGKDLINTLQKSSPEYNGVKINDYAANILRKTFGSYLEKTTGTNFYEQLKQIETARYAAKARDSIPALLSEDFTGEYLDSAIRNIKNSPQGKSDFRVAFSSYLRQLPEEKALKEFNRLYKPMLENNMVETDKLVQLKRQVEKYTSKTAKDKFADVTKTAVKNALVFGIMPAEYINMLAEQPSEPFKM